MLTGRWDGEKLKPFVLMQWTRIDKKIESKFQHCLMLCWRKDKWFNDDTTKGYLERSFKGLAFFQKSKRSLVIWDRFAAHQSESTKELLMQIGLDYFFIPGGPPNLFNVLTLRGTGHLRHEFINFLRIGFYSKKTKGGNPKAPSMDIYLKWDDGWLGWNLWRHNSSIIQKLWYWNRSKWSRWWYHPLFQVRWTDALITIGKRCARWKGNRYIVGPT